MLDEEQAIQVLMLPLTSHYASYNLNFLYLSQAPDIDSDLFVEVLGILVNLDIPSYDWPAFIAKHDLLTLLSGKPPTHPRPPLPTFVPAVHTQHA